MSEDDWEYGDSLTLTVIQSRGSDLDEICCPKWVSSGRSSTGVFQDVLNRNQINLGNSTINRLSAIQGAAQDEEKHGVSNVINRFFDAADSNGNMSGQVAYGVKKDLDRMASSADTTQNYHARQARSAVMDAINDSLTGADQAAFGEARGQFRNMKQLEGAISKDGSGDISASRMANILGQKANRGQSVYGRGDQTLVDLAQAGKQLIPDQTGNSGTVSRALMQLGLPVLAGGGEALATGDWVGGLKTAGTIAALPKLAQYAMNNPALASYLANGLGQGGMRDALMAPQQGLLGGAMRRSLPSTFNGLLAE